MRPPAAAVLWRTRCTLAIALFAAGAGAASWATFVVARGVPGECGGDAPPCPPGSASAFLALFACLLVLAPLGCWLVARRRPELAVAGVGVAPAGAAVGILCSRYVADPITDATSTTLWTAGIFGGIALLIFATAGLLLAGAARRG